MEKILTNELRWLYRDNNMVLQQKIYFEYSNESTWQDVPCVVENK